MLRFSQADLVVSSALVVFPARAGVRGRAMRAFSVSWRVFPAMLVLVLALGSTPAYASVLNIIPTFASSITSDPNAATIESTINTAINYYDSTFTTATAAPIGVTIQFQEGGGLGGSSAATYTIPYQNFISALTVASSGNSTDVAALANLPISTTNPVTGSTHITVKTAELRALGFSAAQFPNGGFDGTITLNTSLTTPGSPGSSLEFSLLATTEHEIDEVLGIGSDLGTPFSDPSPEDLFRYASSGVRSYTTNGSALAYFSLDGTTHLAQFDNQNDGGDFGDWQSNPLPNGVGPKVQDAFGTPGSSPTLATDAGIPEIIALDAIGYNLAETSEPSSLILCGSVLVIIGGATRWRVGLRKNGHVVSDLSR